MDAAPNVVDADPSPPNDLPPPAAGEPVAEPSDRVLLGVAGHLADHLGLDALWVRLAFVVLALTGGVGIVIYLAAWLVLFGPVRTGVHWVRYVGGAIALIGVPIMISNGNLEFFDGPVAVVALLIGLALALWQPRSDPTMRRDLRQPLPSAVTRWPMSTSTTPIVDDTLGPEGDAPSDGPGRPMTHATRPARPIRPRREPSLLGRATLGLAVIVAAGGALIDQFNGGRLHPEQWLGAAALVCGLGLLVGVVRGRAWWLIVPALLFAGTGYLAGLMSRLGIEGVDAVGDQSLYVSDATPGGTATLESGLGSIWITLDGAPADPLTIDARSALGTVEVRAVDDVAIEIRSESDSGDLIVDGVVASGGVMRIGPDRTPDVIVDARQGIGDVVVWTYFPEERVLLTPTDRPVGDRAVPPLGARPDVGVTPTPPAIPGAPATTVPPDPSATTTSAAPSTTIGD
jgi:phage shock protein PspC (stress-responsive transcriptional regulator)